MPQSEKPGMMAADEIDRRIRQAAAALKEINSLARELHQALAHAQAETARATAQAERERAAQQAVTGPEDGERRRRGRPPGSTDSYPRTRRPKEAAPRAIVRFA